MALDFDPATPQYLERTITLVSAYPFSIVAWIYKDSAAAAGVAVSIGDDVNNYHSLGYNGAEDVQAKSSAGVATTTGAGSNDAWIHAAGVWASATSRTAYRDGANSATNTTSRVIGTVDTFRIGNTGADIATWGEEWPGALAEVAVYNIALSTDELAMLSRGVSPLAVRPDALVSYVPLIGRATAEPDLIQGGAMTHVSTPSQFAHPRIIYPGRAKLILVPSAAAAQDLTPSLFTNTNTFYAATVAAGAVDLTPSLFANDNTFFTQVVTTGAVDLTPSLFANDNTFFTQVVTTGAVDLTPSLFANDNTFYSATVAPGAVDLTPSLFANDNTFYTQLLEQAGEAQDLTPSLFANDNTFYAAIVATGAVGLTPDLFENTNTFYAQTLAATYALTPDLFASSNTFYAAVVAPGAVDLTPDLFESANTFPTHVVAATYAITPDLFTNSSTFGAATVAPGAVDLTPSLFANDNTFYVAQVVDADAVGGFGPWMARRRTHWPPAW